MPVIELELEDDPPTGHATTGGAIGVPLHVVEDIYDEH